MAQGDPRGGTRPRNTFVIGPIGSDKAPIGSLKYEIWAAAQEVWETIILPACERHGILPLRADQITRAGEITDQVFEALRDSDLVIADLTGANPNVMYELALRHHNGGCVILITEYEKLPFDVAWVRAIEFTRTPLGLIHGRQQLEAAIATYKASGCGEVTAARIMNGQKQAHGPGELHAKGDLSVTPELEGDEPGFVDIVAEMESALPRLGEHLQGITAEFQQMGTMADESAAELAAQPSMAGRLPAIARFASSLDAHADRLDILVANYGNDVTVVDAGVKALLDRLDVDPQLQGQASEFLSALVRLGAASDNAFSTYDGLAGTVEGLAPLARVLKQPARRIAATIRSLREVSHPVSAWAQRATTIMARVP